MTKRCKQCGESKPVEAFYRQKGGRLGREARCKVCREAEKRARPGRPCTVEGCTRLTKEGALCRMHEARLRIRGEVGPADPVINQGSRKALAANGYMRLYLPDHPCADRRGWAHEHRVVAYDAGLLTDLTLVVHHKNHNKLDNRLENLEALTPSEHAAQHRRDRAASTDQREA